jgi:hypothetical protein
LHRLTIFAKGNLDVHDSLHSLRIGGELVWNGVNEIVGARFPRSRALVRHEIWNRSDALLEAKGTIPAELSARALPLGAFSLQAQFSDALFTTDADAIVLSIQPDLTAPLLRHRRDGYLLCPNNWEAWPAPDRRWLHSEFVTVQSPDVATSMSHFARIVERIRARTQVPILVYNVSSVVQGDSVHSHEGWGDILSTRIRRFNLGLIELSQRTGVSIIDVDAIVARAGADRAKLDALHLTAMGCRLVAEEVVRVLDEVGCFAGPEVERCS